MDMPVETIAKLLIYCIAEEEQHQEFLQPRALALLGYLGYLGEEKICVNERTMRMMLRRASTSVVIRNNRIPRS